jgi:hypothetical protein
VSAVRAAANLDRARVQLCLLQSMLARRSDMIEAL